METQISRNREEPNVTSTTEARQQIQLKPGTYMLHIYIEEARSLVPPNNDELCDPVFTVSAFGVTKSTKEFCNVTSLTPVKIFEHLYIEAKDKSPEEIQNERVLITVKDNSLLNIRKTLIGLHEIDLVYIYSSDTHGILHRWIVLSNPDDKNFNVMRGYLKIGISLLHETDRPVDLSAKEDLKEKDRELLIPPHIIPKAVQLIVQLFKGESLPRLDSSSGLDAYCVVRFASAESKSSVYVADAATLTAYWFEEIMIPALIPCVTSTVTLTFWNHNSIFKDDLIGCITMNFDKVKKGKQKSHFWANIYGAPHMATGDIADYMNRVPSAATHWRGRILLRAWVEENVKETYKRCIPIQDPNLCEFIRDEYETGEDYELRVQVISASALPKKSGSYSVRVEWSGIITQSTNIETENGCADWFETLKRKTTIIPKGCEAVLPDVFVYLVYKDEKISYLRLSPMNCQDFTKEAVWERFLPDKSAGNIAEDWNSGLIKVRVYIGKLNLCNEDLVKYNWKKIAKPELELWNLYVHAFQCRDLPAADRNGLADPYLKIYCAGQEAPEKKDVRECTLNPRWYETYHLKIKISSIKESAPIVVYVFDYDIISKDDILGVTFIEIADASIEPVSVPRPKWREISLGRKGTEKGKILMSFSLFKEEIKKPFNIVPEFEDKNIQINILGLRDLKPAVGWLPVNKAFIKFDLNALSLPGESTGLKTVQTQPFDSGSDPNINSTVSFKCKMPIDAIYSPYLTATVHDYLFHGMSQPLIGSFCLDLGKYSNQYLANKLITHGLAKKKEKKFPRISIKKTQDEIKQFFESQENLKRCVSEPYEKMILRDSSDNLTEEKSITLNSPKMTSEESKEHKLTEEFSDLSPLIPQGSNTNEKRPKNLELLVVDAKNSDELSSGNNSPNLSPGSVSGRSSLSQQQKELIERNKIELEIISHLNFEEICSEKNYVTRKALYEFKKKTVRKEVDIPSSDKYISISYNRNNTDNSKYYRYYIKEPLEKTHIFSHLPFKEIEIYKGQERGLENSCFEFDRQLNEICEYQSIQKVGKFKFLLRMTNYPPPEPDENDRFFKISKSLLNITKCIIRVYIIDAFDLESKDKLSESDPFVRVKIGKCKQDNKSEYQKNNNNPSIYKAFELPATLPGKSMLKVQFWDFNSLTTNTKIGTTKIDLEDRFFNEKWLALEEKPIETRPLKIKSARRPQGYVRLWVEILESRSQKPVEDISTRPPGHFEARVIIWRAEDVAAMDSEGLSDAFVSVSINNSTEKETDTHFRAKKNPCWNWRMKFQITISSTTKFNNMKIQLWDRDALSQNDFISEGNVDFNEIAKKAWEENCSVHQTGHGDSVNKRIKNELQKNFWVQCFFRNDAGEDIKCGKVLVSLELVPKSKAEAIPVGEGRDEPNVHPRLESPRGRIQLSWNPVKMVCQLIGPEYRMQACVVFVSFLILIACVVLVPMLVSSLITKYF